MKDLLRVADSSNIFVERLWRSVKYEDIYLKEYNDLLELTDGLKDYFLFYNHERPHQSFRYQFPWKVYETGKGGGAIIQDKYGRSERSGGEKQG